MRAQIETLQHGNGATAIAENEGSPVASERAHSADIELDTMSLERDGEGAAEPLITRHSAGHDAEEETGYRRSGRDHDEEEDLVTFGWFIWILTFSAGVSGLLFGYEYVLCIMMDSYVDNMLRSISM